MSRSSCPSCPCLCPAPAPAAPSVPSVPAQPGASSASASSIYKTLQPPAPPSNAGDEASWQLKKELLDTIDMDFESAPKFPNNPFLDLDTDGLEYIDFSPNVGPTNPLQSSVDPTNLPQLDEKREYTTV